MVQERSLFRIGVLMAGIAPLLGFVGCTESSPSNPLTAASILTGASVAGVPGATVTSSTGAMTTGAAPAPVVSSSSVATPGSTVTLSVRTAAPASQVLVGVQGAPGFVTINLGVARSRQTGPQTYLITITLGGNVPNPLVLTVETADQAGALSQAATITLTTVQPVSGAGFAGRYAGSFSGNVINSGVSTPISGTLTAIIDSSGAFTAIGTPTQGGESPATFTGTVSQSGAVSATSPASVGRSPITLTGLFQTQGSASTGAGSITGGDGAQITWSASRVSTTVSASLFAGSYTGQFSGSNSTGGPLSGNINATVDTNGNFTATGTPAQAGQSPVTFTGAVSPTGRLSASGTPPGGGPNDLLTLVGAFQLNGGVVTAAGTFSNASGASGQWSLQPSAR